MSDSEDDCELSRLLKDERELETIETTVDDTIVLPLVTKLRPIPSKTVNDSSIYVDLTTGLRINSLCFTQTEIKSKLSLTKLIRLSQIEQQSQQLPNDWCTLAILANKADIKQAANGSNYSCWRLTDFKTQQQLVTLLVFGDAHKTLWKTTLGSVFLLYNPDVKKGSSLSIHQTKQFCLLGMSPDLGQCKSKTKQGEQCKMYVNRSECEYCTVHAYHLYTHQNKVSSTSRMNLQSTGAFAPKKFLYNQIMDGTCYGGKMYTATTPKHKKSSTAPSTPKSSNERLNDKEKSLLVMLGIEQDPLICVRTENARGMGDTIADIKQIYQTKRMNQSKRIEYDETKRDELPSKLSVSHPLPPSQPTAVSQTNTQNKTAKYVDLSIKPSNEAINTAKQRAIDILKQRLSQKQQNESTTKRNDQSLVLATTTTSNKRSIDSDEINCSKRLKPSSTNENDDENRKQRQRFEDVMNIKSSHANVYDDITLQECFDTLKKKEEIEEKLLKVTERTIKVIVCRLCHYTSYKQSILCKKKQHTVKICDVQQRFFECCDCGQRVFTWNKYPENNCTKCRCTKFNRTSLIRERHGPKLEGEILLLRGEEETFLNSYATYEKLPSVICDTEE
ncbi:unnamed protein product [Didymodactylos carnosus]|nr:unnamed protein product [Didymodactylos carnosus]CAF3835028.1 unnamed protein product [Didymodactylos carnosus]